MSIKSTFNVDLAKEKKLYPLLNSLYTKHLKYFKFKRTNELNKQLKGIDLIFYTKQVSYNIDEKAQLDYIGEDLPTFAFEVQYQKNGNFKEGWLFDDQKETDFYALITAIQEDEPGKFTSCKITLVNRVKLVTFLKEKGITKQKLENYFSPKKQGKLKISELHSYYEGYLYFSTHNKAEKPINLILKLDFLLEIGVAKRLI